MGTPLLDRRVRFGDTTYGSCLHYAEIFEWIICAVEELGVKLAYTTDEIVASGGIPYAPVEVVASMNQYPTYGDEVRINACPVYVSERSFKIEYVLTRRGDDSQLGRIHVVHVSVAPDGQPEPVSEHVTDRLRALSDEYEPSALPVALNDSSVTFSSTEQSFSIQRTFRTPHIEAVNLGYFEDYARFMSVALEDHLEETGQSLGSLCKVTGRWPLQPREWTLTFHNPIRFEDKITVRGQIESAIPEGVCIAYAFDGDGDDDRRIAGRILYGCCDDDGRIDAPNNATLETLIPSD